MSPLTLAVIKSTGCTPRDALLDLGTVRRQVAEGNDPAHLLREWFQLGEEWVPHLWPEGSGVAAQK